MSDPHRNKRLYERNKDFIRRVKRFASCEVCGYDKHPAALEFHHEDAAKKTFSIGSPGTSSIERIKKEIRKCRILCANCHNIQHHDARSSNW